MSAECGAVDSRGNVCVREPDYDGRHLRANRLPPGHYCHARGCNQTVPPKMLMCLKHWRMVPHALQSRVWATYRPGQEDDKSPSDAYLTAQEAAVTAVYDRELAAKTAVGS